MIRIDTTVKRLMLRTVRSCCTGLEVGCRGQELITQKGETERFGTAHLVVAGQTWSTAEAGSALSRRRASAAARQGFGSLRRRRLREGSLGRLATRQAATQRA
jgi:hypothetical protein